MTDMLEKIDLCLRVLMASLAVPLSPEELSKVRKIALAYLDAELGLSEVSNPRGDD
ncbi:MAG: hypothetical protein HY296_03165 [Thaumarchaeota archaeon]|nr:hypothetical protein [Nitrososphaerota archaeon]